MLDWIFTSKIEEDQKHFKRYYKTIAKVGEYVHTGAKFDFAITNDLLDHWNLSFKEFNEAGIKVPIPLGHSVDPKLNKGFVTGLFKNQDKLIAQMDLVASEADDLVASQDVSLYSPPEYEDSKGKKHKRPIVHVALTPYPVLPGLGDFSDKAIACSLNLSDSEIEELKLSLKGRSMDLEKLKGAFGVEEVTEDSLIEKFQSLSTERDELQKKIKTAGKKLELSKPMLEIVTDSRMTKVDSLVKDRKIAPAVGESLKKILCSEDRISLALSNEDKTFEELVLAFSQGPDIFDNLELSRHQGTLDPDKNPLIKNAKARREALLTK
jgi:hypothetical protein